MDQSCIRHKRVIEVDLLQADQAFELLEAVVADLGITDSIAKFQVPQRFQILQDHQPRIVRKGADQVDADYLKSAAWQVLGCKDFTILVSNTDRNLAADRKGPLGSAAVG